MEIKLPGGVTVTNLDRHHAVAEVDSSDPTREPYAVVVTSGGVARCQCKGFVYRGKCRHIDAVRAAAGL
jgi:hypothetical protein